MKKLYSSITFTAVTDERTGKAVLYVESYFPAGAVTANHTLDQIEQLVINRISEHGINVIPDLDPSEDE